jgi:glycosyltransferase involved in cell wall biosynthesis
LTQAISAIIIIPVFNGRDSLIKLLRSIKGLGYEDVLIINDGSTDGLRQADIEPFQYIQHDRNRGKGAALRSGLAYASRHGFTHAVSLDADGQHDPELIKDFLSVSALLPQDLVVGKRDFVHHAMPIHRKLSNHITSLMLSLRTGVRIHDSQVGYRVYPLYDSRLWDSNEDGFQFESDVFFRLAPLKLGLRWISIPVIYGEQDSHMDLVRDTLRFVRMFIRSLINF